MSNIELSTLDVSVDPPDPRWDDMGEYAKALQLIESLTEDQRHIVLWASAVVDARDTPALPTGRREVRLIEAIRGVKCCNPAVTAQWRLWRLCGAVVCVIVGVGLVAGGLFGAPGVGVVLGLAALMSMRLSFGILRGSATVCH